MALEGIVDLVAGLGEVVAADGRDDQDTHDQTDTKRDDNTALSLLDIGMMS